MREDKDLSPRPRVMRMSVSGNAHPWTLAAVKLSPDAPEGTAHAMYGEQVIVEADIYDKLLTVAHRCFDAAQFADCNREDHDADLFEDYAAVLDECTEEGWEPMDEEKLRG